MLVNGSPCDFFPGSCGIRQGDPLSPALFTIIADILSRILARAENVGKISGIKVSRLSPMITHLMYADDLVIYSRANLEEAQEIKNCLDLYCNWTDQCINWEKSNIYYSYNVQRASRLEICRLLGMRECSHSGKYLGNPFYRFKFKNAEFKHIVDRIAAKLTGWKVRHLSMASRNTLIKSITLSIHSYTMQTFLLPVGICNKIDTINIRFL